MDIAYSHQNYEQLTVIVNCGLGSKVLQTAKKSGLTGGTVMIGRGTITSRILNFFELTDIRREIVTMIGDKKAVRTALAIIQDVLKLDKPNHGIAYTTSVCFIGGSKRYSCHWQDLSRGDEQAMYQAITVVVEKGKAEDVIDAALKAGSKGGTIINARGSGVHETSRLFAMDIEPEKEMVLILSKSEQTEKIVSSIRTSLKIDEPGMGILYIQHVNEVCGLYE